MYVISLIANPERRNLDERLIENLWVAWGGWPPVNYLDPGVAVEFELGHVPSNRWKVWQMYQSEGIDLMLQKSEGRRKKLLLADMDSTMIQQECVDELAVEAGVGDRVAEITSRAMSGKVDFEEALRERVSLLKGLPTTVIERVFDQRITYMPGGKTVVATMKAHGSYAALVSGGFTSFSKRVAAQLGFDEHRANELIEHHGLLTGEVNEPILGGDAKVEALKEICARLRLQPSDVIAVGDGANDLGMLNTAGMGVAFHAKPSVEEKCEISINHGDLTSLLYLQGYSRSEFVTDE